MTVNCEGVRGYGAVFGIGNITYYDYQTPHLKSPRLAQAPESLCGYHQVIQDFHTE